MKIHKKDLIFNIVMLILLMICTVFSRFRAFSVLSLAVYLSYWVYLALGDKFFFVKYLNFVFAALGTVAGAAVIELGESFTLGELSCRSLFSGSLPLLIFAYWLFSFVLQICDQNFGQRIEDNGFDRNNKRVVRVLNYLTAFSAVVLLALLLYTVWRAPSALSSGIDRFVYAMRYPLPGFWAKISDLSYMLLVFPLLSLAYGNRLLAAVPLGSYVLFYLWTGNKFGSFFSLLCTMLIVFYPKIRAIDRKKLIRVVTLLGAGMVLLVGVAAFIQVRPDQSGANIGTYLLHRTAGQGQLWWRTYDLFHGDPHPGEFRNEIEAVFIGTKSVQGSVGAQNGIYKVMYLCAPTSIVNSHLERGIRYSQADYAAVYYYFGTAGVVAYSLVMGVVISGIVNGFILMLNRKDYIKALIFLRFYSLVRTSFSMFLFSDFVDPVSILSYLYLIVFARRKPRLRLRETLPKSE